MIIQTMHCHTQDHYAYLECVKYMVKLAVHFGDTRRAEMYKRNLQTLIDEEYRFGWAGTALGLSMECFGL